MSSELFSGGNLIVDGNQTLIIEDTTYVHTGNVVVKDSATLIIRNAVLQLELENDWQYNCTIKDNGTLRLEGGTIMANKAAILSIEDTANLITDESSRLEFHSFLSTGSTTVNLTSTTVDVRYLNMTCDYFKSFESTFDLKGSGHEPPVTALINCSSFLLVDSTIGMDARECSPPISSLAIYSSDASILTSTIRVYCRAGDNPLGLITINSTSTLISNSTVHVYSHATQHNVAGGYYNASLLFMASNMSIKNSQIITESKCWIHTYSGLTLSSPELLVVDSYLAARDIYGPYEAVRYLPIKIEGQNTIAYLYNVTIPQSGYGAIEAQNKDTIIFRYWYLLATVVDSQGTSLPSANVTVLDYLNETIVTSKITDVGGNVRIPLLSEIITPNGSRFVGNYEVIAKFDFYGYLKSTCFTAQQSISMQNNVDLILTLPAVINPVVKVTPNTITAENLMLGMIRITINVYFEYDNSYVYVEDAIVKVNGLIAEYKGKGVYTATLQSWMPFSTINIEVERTDFDFISFQVTGYSIGNILVYTTVILAVIVSFKTYRMYNRMVEEKKTKVLETIKGLIKQRGEGRFKELTKELKTTREKVEEYVHILIDNGEIEGTFTFDGEAFITNNKIDSIIIKREETKLKELAMSLRITTEKVEKNIRRLCSEGRIKGYFTSDGEGFIRKKELERRILRDLYEENKT